MRLLFRKPVVAVGVLTPLFFLVALNGLTDTTCVAEPAELEVDAGPSWSHLLGTDRLGRDRLCRVSLGLAYSLSGAFFAAALSVTIAAAMGIAAAVLGGFLYRALLASGDLFLCVPWLFALLTVRSLLPLNAPPVASLLITYLFLGLLSWPLAVRIIAEQARKFLKSDCFLFARASGQKPWQLYRVHFASALLPVLSAQFWLLVPLFLLSEANLGLLGLGVSEPLPSVGGLLRVLTERFIPWEQPLDLVTPLLLCVLLVAMHRLLPEGEWAQ